MDAEEMFRRGVADAERGEPNPFYYQHYYHYRRGVNRARRRGCLVSRSWLPLVAAALVAVAAAAFVVGGSRFALVARPPATASPPARSVAAPSTPRPTAQRTPTPRPATPTIAQAVLRVGGLARVTNTGGRPLRGRSEPSLAGAPQAGFREGEQVEVLEGPVEADGYTWWRVRGEAGVGWSAQQSQEGAIWLSPVAP